MRIEDFDSEHNAASPRDIAAALSKRDGRGINSFWLYHGAEKYPTINIMVKGDLAYVHYFLKHRHPGYASVAKVLGPRPNETSIFFLYPTEKVWVRNDALVPFSDALKVAQEFATSTEMPKCIQWNSLIAGE
jgi:hypothetical protein